MYSIGKIITQYLINSAKEQLTFNNNSKDTITSNAQRLRNMTDLLEKEGGIFSKLAQMLSYNQTGSDIFSDCKPYSRGETIQYLKDYHENNIVLYSVNDIEDVYKSGSVGQVHIGDDYHGNKLAIKTQYVGLEDKTKNDLYYLNKLRTFMFAFVDSSKAFDTIEKQLLDELEYSIEIDNHDKIYNLWKNSSIYIPKIYREHSTDKIIVTEFIEDAMDFKTFNNTSTQAQKNKIGMDIIKFIFTTLFKYNLLYSDCHYGNILVKNEKLCVLDFGSVQEFEDDLLEQLKHLYKFLKTDSKQQFINMLYNMGILTPGEVSKDSEDYAFDYFKLQFEPWLTKGKFTFSAEWLSKCTKKDEILMKQWKLPYNMVYLNKIPYGLYHVLSALNTTGEFRKVFEDILFY